MEESRSYKIAGKVIICSHCQSTKFDYRRYFRGYGGFRKLAFWREPAYISALICSGCSKIQFYFETPQSIE